MTALAWLLAWSGDFCAGVLAERIMRYCNRSLYSRK